MNIKEQMAKGIYDKFDFEPTTTIRVKPEWQDGGNSLKQQEARDYAKASIRALREVDKSKIVSIDCFTDSTAPHRVPDEKLTEAFNSMLTAILEEGL